MLGTSLVEDYAWVCWVQPASRAVLRDTTCSCNPWGLLNNPRCWARVVTGEEYECQLLNNNSLFETPQQMPVVSNIRGKSTHPKKATETGCARMMLDIHTQRGIPALPGAGTANLAFRTIFYHLGERRKHQNWMPSPQEMHFCHSSGKP